MRLAPSIPRFRKAGLPDIDPIWVRWGALIEEIGGRR